MSTSQPRVLAIIQAQTRSRRNLAGAESQPVFSVALLKQTVERLKRSARIGLFAVATGSKTDDDAIVAFANANGIHVVRGSDDDALSPFARCAETLGADYLVRVATATPDPDLIDRLLSILIAEGADYVLPANSAGAASDAVDVFSRRALDRLMMDARTDLLARREVTGYLRAYPNFVRTVRAPAPVSEGGANLELAKATAERLAANGGEASLSDLMTLVVPASGETAPLSGSTALIRCDAGAHGHDRVKRMIALARALRDEQGIAATFAVRSTKIAEDLIRRSGFPIEPVAADDEWQALSSIIAARRPKLFILDCLEGPSMLEVRRLKREVALTAVIDDPSSRRLVADVAYYSPVPRAERLDWRDTQTIVRLGWKWALLGGAPIPPRIRAPSPHPTVLVMMGESVNLTLLVARALASLPTAFRARFVLPRSVADRNGVARTIVTLKPGFETIEGADDFSTEYASADIAVAAFGPAAYELAAAGVPAIYLCTEQDDSEVASAFEHAGMGVSLGLASETSGESVIGAVRQLLSDSARQRDMRAAALMTIDMNGASRIAADLVAILSQRRAEPDHATLA